MITIITTVGTSLITNNENSLGVNKNAYNSIKNKGLVDVELTPSEKKNIDILKNSLRTIIKSKEPNICSAETKSIQLIEKSYKNETFQYVFICSDTAISYLCAELIREKLNIDEKNTIKKIKGLQVRDKELFNDAGLKELFKTIEEYSLLSDWKDDVVLNITGGFKATIPYLSVYAQLLKIPLYYVFEDSNQLIRFPKLPLQYDFDIISNNMPLFKFLYGENGNGTCKIDDINQYKLKEIDGFIEKDENLVCLNAFGKSLYEKQLNCLGYVSIYEPIYSDIIKNDRWEDITGVAQELISRAKKGQLINNFECNTNENLLHVRVDQSKNVFITKIQNHTNGRTWRVLCRFNPECLPYNLYVLAFEDGHDNVEKLRALYEKHNENFLNNKSFKQKSFNIGK